MFKYGTANRNRGIQRMLTGRRFGHIPVMHSGAAYNTVPASPFKLNRCWLENKKYKNRRNHLDNWIHTESLAITCPYQQQHSMA